MRIPDYTISSFLGVNTVTKDLKTLKKGVSPDSLNWITGRDLDHIELRRGMIALELSNLELEKITGLGVGVRNDGLEVTFSHGQKVKYYDVVTDENYEISFGCSWCQCRW